MSFSNAPCEDQFLVENTCTSIDALVNSFVQWCQMYFFRESVQLVEDLLYTDFDCNCQIFSFGRIYK